MTTIVKGHRARVDGKESFVPDGTTVKMYAEYDVDLSTAAALVAITSGDFASPNDEATDQAALRRAFAGLSHKKVKFT